MDQLTILDEMTSLLEKFRSVSRKSSDFARLRQIYSNSSRDPLTQFKDHIEYANITL